MTDTKQVPLKILLVYYSRTGKTAKLAEAIKKEFQRKGHIVAEEIIRPQREKSFWTWSLQRIFHNSSPIQKPQIADVSDFDIICLGSPNWTKLSLPMTTYLKIISGLKHKKVGFFATTFLTPSFEGLIFSSFSLDWSVDRNVSRKGGRFITNLLLSSRVKSWRYDSPRGKEKIESFCRQLLTPTESLQQYLLSQKERETVRMVIVFLPLILISFFIFELSNFLLHQQPNFRHYFLVAGTTLFGFIPSLVLLLTRKKIKWAKYITGITLSAVWSVTLYLINPAVGRLIIPGYIFLLIFISFFHHAGAVMVTGVASCCFYLLLTLTESLETQLFPVLDTFLIGLGTVITALFASDLSQYQTELIRTQADLEKAHFKLKEQYLHIKEEKNKTQSIINHLNDGLLVFNEKKQLEFMNPSAENMLKCSSEKIWKEKQNIKNCPQTEILQKFLDNKEKISEIQLTNNRSAEMTILPTKVDNSQEKMTLVILRDTTKERNLETMKVDFSSIVAHELRTPITTVRGYLSILQEEETTNLSPEGQKCLDRSVKGCENLNAMIDSLLAVTRIERGQTILTAEIFDLRTLIEETVKQVTPQFEKKKQLLKVDIPEKNQLIAYADKLKTQQILINLISNAIKYTPEKGKISIGGELDRQFVIIHIQDNGPGIPKSAQENLFQKFSRGEDLMKKETSGVGLGLFLVKSLIEMQGGTVWLDSQEGQGSTFHFKLPRPLNHNLLEKTN